VRIVGAGEVSALGLRRLIERDGGFTLDLPTGRRVSDGISVCSRPWRSLRFRRDAWDDDLVEGWLATINVTGRRTRHVGGWLDPRSDHVWLDLVRVVPPTMRPVACAVARLFKQRCVFDLGRRELVTVGRRAA
jgi:hypothetical protein